MTREEEAIIAMCKEIFKPGVTINNSNLVKCRIRPKVTANSIFKFDYEDCFIFRTNKEGQFTVWTREKGFANIEKK